MGFGRLVLRLVVGVLMIGHGLQKLAGLFGGHGLQGTGEFFDSLGLRPGRQAAMAAGAAEVGGGALLTLGLATPLAAASLGAVVLTGGRTVHAQHGLWATEGGYEYNVVLLASLFELAYSGPGLMSLDGRLISERKGLLWATLASAAAVGGSIAVEQRAEASSSQ